MIAFIFNMLSLATVAQIEQALEDVYQLSEQIQHTRDLITLWSNSSKNNGFAGGMAVGSLRNRLELEEAELARALELCQRTVLSTRALFCICSVAFCTCSVVLYTVYKLLI